jgi:hypothetical protein
VKIFGYLLPAKYDFLLDFGFFLIYIGMETTPLTEEEIKNE